MTLESVQVLDLIVLASARVDHELDVIERILCSVAGRVIVQSSTLNQTWPVLLTEPTSQGYYQQHHTQLVVLDHDQLVDQTTESVTQVGINSDPIDDFLLNSNQSNSTITRTPTSSGWDKLVSSPDYSPPLPVGVDQSEVVWLSTCSLAQLGLISADYLLLSTYNHSTKHQRLVQAYSVPPSFTPDFDLDATVVLSPQLDRNISSASSSGPAQSTSLLVELSRATISPDDIGVAQSVTISAVVSDSGSKRSTQAEVFEKLSLHFASSNAQVGVGDTIQVYPTQDRIRFSHQNSIELSYSPAGSYIDQAVSFVVVDIDHPLRHSDLTVSKVDTTQTRIIQAGSIQPKLNRQLNIAPVNSTGVWDSTFFDYVSSFCVAGSSDYNLDNSLLVSGKSGVGKATLTRRVAQALGLNVVEVDMFDLIESNQVSSLARLSATVDHATACSPAILLIRNLHALSSKSSNSNDSTQERKMTTLLEQVITRSSIGLTTGPLIIVGTSSNPESIDSNLASLFSRSFNLHPPDQQARAEILDQVCAELSIGLDVSIADLAQRTAALVPRDLVNLVNRATQAATLRVQAKARLGVSRPRVSVNERDFEIGLSGVRASYSASIGAPKIPSVSFAQVGGLSSVKDEILETIQLPLSQPDLFGPGLKKRSGILLYGPPGTGKTLLAKAVATSCSLNFFSVKGPELLDMYIGESEANVRRVFERAREAKPCVIFFDELDSVAPKRGNQGDSGGVMDRIVSQLLAELDGMQGGDGQGGGGDVFVIGATNRPDLLDPALLRPGRFDRMLYLGLSQDHSDQENILKALTRDFTLDRDVDLYAIAEECPMNLTGADLYALCSDAMLKAMTTKATQIDHKLDTINRTIPEPLHPITAQYYLAELAGPTDIQVVVNQRHFLDALAQVSSPILTDGEELSPPAQLNSSFRSSVGSQCVRGGDAALQGELKWLGYVSGGSGANRLVDGVAQVVQQKFSQVGAPDISGGSYSEKGKGRAIA